MKRRLMISCAGAAPLLLAGCASIPSPTRWYELKGEPPEAVPAPRPGDGAVWELSGRVPLPGALDRDTLVVSSAAASVVPLVGHRWVQPLRESIPVRLAADLALLRGPGLVWPGPAPAGVTVARRLRVEIDTLVADEARQVLRLRSRWWLTYATSAAPPPRTETAEIDVALADGSADTLAAAHRLALWRLALRIAGTP